MTLPRTVRLTDLIRTIGPNLTDGTDGTDSTDSTDGIDASGVSGYPPC
jgi:hypothetical protein